MKPNAENYNKNGEKYFDSYMLHEAIEEYNKAIELDGNNAKFYNNRRNLYHSIGKSDKAMEAFNKAIELDDKNIDAYLGRAAIYKDNLDYEMAIEDYSMAIAADPYYSRLYILRARAYNYTYDIESAINDYSNVIALEAKMAKSETSCSNDAYNMAYEDARTAYKERGEIYYASGNNIGAIKDYTKAIYFGDDSEEIYCLRGNAYLAAGYYDSAVEDLDYAIESASHYNCGETPIKGKLYNTRGDIYYSMGEYDKAIEDYSKATDFNQNEAELYRAYHSRGKVYMKQARDTNDYAGFAAACRDFTKAAELKENFTEAYEALAECYRLMADCELDGQRKIEPSEKLTNYKNMLKAYENITKKCIIYNEHINNGKHRSYYDSLTENARDIISSAEASVSMPIREAADICMLTDDKTQAPLTELKQLSPAASPECVRFSL